MGVGSMNKHKNGKQKPVITKLQKMKGERTMVVRIESGATGCPVCGGNLVPGKYDHVVGGHHVQHESGEIKWMQHVILDVPALICAKCGSPWVRSDDEILETLQTYVTTSAEQDVFVSTVSCQSISVTVH